MTDTLEERYSEAAPYIEQAVDEHGEAWVLENYYQKLYPLARIMSMPEKEDFPFYDPDKHETMIKSEQVEMYQAWAEYRENLRNASEQTDQSQRRVTILDGFPPTGGTERTLHHRAAKSPDCSMESQLLRSGGRRAFTAAKPSRYHPGLTAVFRYGLKGES